MARRGVSELPTKNLVALRAGVHELVLELEERVNGNAKTGAD